MRGHRSQPLQRDPLRACQRPLLLPLPRAGGTLQKDTVSRDGVTGWPGRELRVWEPLIRGSSASPAHWVEDGSCDKTAAG